MTPEQMKISFQKEVFKLIEGGLGENRVSAYSPALMRFTGDHDSGIFLCQLLYWCDKGRSPSGYIYKTADEWYEETLMSAYRIRKAAAKCKAMGILETKKKRANGAPTIHYKMLKGAFVEALVKFLEKERQNVLHGKSKIKDSLTEITSETPEEITKEHKGTIASDVRGDVRFACFSFKEFTEQYEVDEETADGITYYMRTYKKWIGKDHPRLTEEQWGRVIDDLFNCYDDRIAKSFLINLENLEAMIDQHFGTDYIDCDYNILHFMSDGVKVRRMYEVAY